MAKTFRPYEPDQLLLLPPSLADWVPEDHLARFVSEIVDSLDLSAIEDTYDEEGGSPLRRRAGRGLPLHVVASAERPAQPRQARGAGASLLRPDDLDRAAYLETPTTASAYLLIRGLFTPAHVRRLLGLSPCELGGAPFAPPPKTQGGVREALTRRDISHYLGNQLLRDGAVMSMAHSVEMRVPYLDHRIVERVLSLPARFKLARERPKPLFLDALDGRIPRAVWNRPKMGFTFPMTRWMRERAPKLRATSLESKLLDRRAIERVWDGFCRGRDHWSRPWALYVLSQFESGVERGMSYGR